MYGRAITDSMSLVLALESSTFDPVSTTVNASENFEARADIEFGETIHATTVARVATQRNLPAAMIKSPVLRQQNKKNRRVIAKLRVSARSVSPSAPNRKRIPAAK